MHELRLPLFICGEPLEGTEIALDFDGPLGPTRVLLPRIGPDEIQRAAHGPRDVGELSLEEVLAFFAKASALWSDESLPLRQEAFAAARRVTGFSEAELRLDLSYLSGILSPEACLKPMLESELREPRVLDHWTTRGPCEVRAFPRGRVLHLLAGNVPGVEALSLVRASLTKNASLLKVASGNPVTPGFLVRLLRAVDPEHPITRSTSVLYWAHGSDAEKAAFDLADAVCVWGGADAVRSAWRRARPGMPFLDYGPKRSMAFVDRASTAGPDGARRIADALAWDLCVHDQWACHSPQVAFVEKPAEPFCKALAEALDRVSAHLPKGFVSVDRNAEISHVRAMAELRGDKVLRPKSNAWTVVLTGTAETPLSRTLFVLEVDDLAQAVAKADPYTMVVGFSSRERRDQLRDALARRGVDRLSLIGCMGLPPPGSPHECRFDLTQLVRFVGCDDGI